MTKEMVCPIADSLRYNKEYLARCQVDTPHDIVKRVWSFLNKLYRSNVEDVIDFGAGDGRFALYGEYKSYTGLEIDRLKTPVKNFPKNAKILYDCAFSHDNTQYDVCIGNPPYVRHHDIDSQWQQKNLKHLSNAMQIKFDLRANAFLYFLSQALLSTKEDGLIALIIPFEWATRPSAKPIRDFIERNQWHVDVYRFTDDIFPRVLTTASLTIIDKSKKNSVWQYFELDRNFTYNAIPSPTGDKPLLAYSKRNEKLYAQRGISPGNQKVFCLTEGERLHHGLKIGRDVIPCLTTLKHLEKNIDVLDEVTFNKFYRDQAARCWLIKTFDESFSQELTAYLESADPQLYNTWTCRQRAFWWQLQAPKIPDIIYSPSFISFGPKIVTNDINAAIIGGAYGIYGATNLSLNIVKKLKEINFEAQIVNHSGALKKIEVNQMNSVLQKMIEYPHFK